MRTFHVATLVSATILLSGCATLTPNSAISHRAPRTLPYAIHHAQWSHLYGGKSGKALTGLEWLALADITGTPGLSAVHETTPQHIPHASSDSSGSALLNSAVLTQSISPDASYALFGLGLLSGPTKARWKVLQKRLDQATHNGVFVELLRVVPRPTTRQGLEELAQKTIEDGLSSIAGTPLPGGAPPIHVQGDSYTTTLMTVTSAQKPEQKYLGTLRFSPNLRGFTAGWWGINPYLTTAGKILMGESVQYSPPFLPSGFDEQKIGPGSHEGYLSLQFARALRIPGHPHHLLVAIQYTVTNPYFQTAAWIARIRDNPRFRGDWLVANSAGTHPLQDTKSTTPP